MAELAISVLGGLQVRLASGARVRLPPKAQALLAYLALRPGQGQPRDKLAALLWPKRGAAPARHSLRQTVLILRKALPSSYSTLVLVEGDAVAIDGARVDAEVFERLVRAGAPSDLEQAVELYRGDLLEGIRVDAAPFEDWLVGERDRLHELALGALARLLAFQRRAGQTERAIQTAVRLLSLDPSQEVVHRALMGLYANQGRRGAVSRQYRVCVDTLRRELGTEPELETRELYQDLLRERSPGPVTAVPLITRTARRKAVPSPPAEGRGRR